MRSRSRAARRVFLALAPALALPAASFAQCPPVEQMGRQIQETFKRPIEVKKVTPSALKGLCEVQVQFQGRANILYTDATGDFFVTGHVIDAKNGKDLTEESLAVMNTFSPAEMQKVSSLAALTVGKGDKVVYFVTDPMWPYCKRAGAALTSLADTGAIQVKVLLFPLPMHQGAKEQCVAVVCDKKGFDDLENGYTSDNQCAEGVKLVDETIAFLQSKGIGSTPSYIFPDGRTQAGVLEEAALRQRLGLPAAAPKGPEAAPPGKKPPASKAPATKPAAPKK